MLEKKQVKSLGSIGTARNGDKTDKNLCQRPPTLGIESTKPPISRWDACRVLGHQNIPNLLQTNDLHNNKDKDLTQSGRRTKTERIYELQGKIEENVGMILWILPCKKNAFFCTDGLQQKTLMDKTRNRACNPTPIKWRRQT